MKNDEKLGFVWVETGMLARHVAYAGRAFERLPIPYFVDFCCSYI